MSGDVTLVDTADGAIGRLVRTASTLFARPGFEPAALVGGLAVTMRLATVHRATNDVDTVADGDGARRVALDYVGGRDAQGSDRVEIDGVKIDIMPTEPLPHNARDLPDGDLDRLFVLGHRWALESAETLDVLVTTADQGVVGPFSLTVASAPALVACKFHAIGDRRDARSVKRESDALDLVRLIGDLVRAPDGIEQFSSAPFDLEALVSAQVERWLIDDATRTAGLVRMSAGATGTRMEPDDIATLGRLFLEAR